MTKSMCHSASAAVDSSRAMRAIHIANELAIFALFAALIICAGCNMNANGGHGNGSAPPPPPPPPQTPTAPNELPIVVGAGTGSPPSMNRPLASVTICVPGTSTCQTINNVLVDSGSTGLRLFESVVSIPLPVQQVSQFSSTYECLPFDNNYAWGPVATADVKLSGEIAPGAAIQLMGDTTYTPPTSCANGLTADSSPQTAGFNGILGVIGQNDCANVCFIGPNEIYNYYVCSTEGPPPSCNPTLQAVAQQVWNPVALFATDNNGVVFNMPGVLNTGQVNVQGSLYFGIGTEANNQLGSANQYQLPMSTQINGTSYFVGVDTGTPFIGYLNGGLAGGLPLCGAFYCPSSPVNFDFVVVGANGAAFNATIPVADPTAAMQQGMTADPTMAGPGPGGNTVMLGFPFFYNMKIFMSWANPATGSINYMAF